MMFQSLILNFYLNIKKKIETIFLNAKKTSKNYIRYKINIFNCSFLKIPIDSLEWLIMLFSLISVMPLIITA